MAVGTHAEPIVFTAASDTPAPGDWYMVYVVDSPASQFSYCVFEYAGYGLYMSLCDPEVSFCTLRNTTLSALVCDVASPHVVSCDITGNAKGVKVLGPDASPVINYCNICDNTGDNLYAEGYGELPVVRVDAENNWWGVDTYAEIDATIVVAGASTPFVDVDFDPWLHDVPVEAASWGRVKSLFAR